FFDSASRPPSRAMTRSPPSQIVNSLGLHIFGATIWLGGLLVIALLRGRLAESKSLRSVVERYSTIALVAFGLVVFSGIVNAALRVHDLDDLMTAYGEVIVAKAVATVLLGLI